MRWRWRKLVVDEGGAVAICSNLEEPPGHSLGGSSVPKTLIRQLRKISHEHDADSWPAWHLARALQRGPVYFLSQLDAETVEDLGLAPVESVDDLVRLAGRHESFVWSRIRSTRSSPWMVRTMSSERSDVVSTSSIRRCELAADSSNSADWSSVTVTGADRQTFLQHFCTNDVKRLVPGDAARRSSPMSKEDRRSWNDLLVARTSW